MSKNYSPFTLKSADLVKEYVRNYLENFNTEKIYAIGLPLPEEIRDVVDQELISYGLPKSTSCMTFKRKAMPFAHYRQCHIDYSPARDETIKTSLVIPIDGCKDTCMFWATGDYVSSVTRIDPIYPLTGMEHYMEVKWNGQGSILDQVEIFDTPMLCRVDIPHSATSRRDGSYRSIMSIRFEENLSIEEIIARRSSMDRTVLS